MRPNLQRQSGLSLIELMVAITAGTIVVFAVSSLLISTLSANSTNMRYTRINQDLRSALVAVSKDLARAGEWILADDIVHASVTSDLLLSGTSGSVTATALQPGSVTTTNVFSFSNAANALTNRTMVILMKNAGVNTRYNLTITGVPSQNSLTLTIPTGTTLPSNKILANSWTIVNPFIGIVVNGANNCVISSYDLDADGVRDSNENFGFRLNAGATAIETSTTATACDAGTWENLTDPTFVTVSSFSVTQLRTSIAAANQLNLALDQYLIAITGTLVSDTSAQRSVQQAVKVRNNAYN